MIRVEVLAFASLERRITLSVSKSAIKIFELFHAGPSVELDPIDVYQLGRDKLGIPEATQQQIHEDFLWLQRQGLIATVLGKRERYQLTELGKSTLPEDLIWEDQKDYHAKLLQKNSKARIWLYVSRLFFILFFTFGIVFLVLTAKISVGPILEDGLHFIFSLSYTLEDGLYIIIRLILGISSLLSIVCFIFFDQQYTKSGLSNEELVFVNMWESYQSLKAYESEKEPAYLKESIKKLHIVARTLQARGYTSFWELENRIQDAFQKVGYFIRSTMIPSIEQKEIREALRQIVTISSLYKARDIVGLTSFAEGLGKIEMPRERRIISLIELRTRPFYFSLKLIGVLTVILLAGSCGVSTIQGRPLISYADSIFFFWFAALVAVVAATVRWRR